MGTYIYKITVIALIGSIIIVLSPQKFSKFISFVVGISLIIAILTPITALIGNRDSVTITLPETNIVTERKENDIHKIGAETLASSIIETITGKYGSVDNNTRIIITTDEGKEFKVISAEIYMEDCEFDTQLAEKHLTNLYGFNITIYD